MNQYDNLICDDCQFAGCRKIQYLCICALDFLHVGLEIFYFNLKIFALKQQVNQLPSRQTVRQETHYYSKQQNRPYEIIPRITDQNLDETTPSLQYAEIYLTNTQKHYNTSEYYFTAIYSDCKRAQHNTLNLLHYIIKTYKRARNKNKTKIHKYTYYINIITFITTTHTI